jgi:hypothetical protein
MTLTALDDKIDSVLDVFNVLFYSIFLVEMVAKILGMGTSFRITITHVVKESK